MATYDLPVVIPNNGTRVIAGPLDFLRLHASTGALRVIAEGRITTLVEGQAVSYKTPREGVEIENLSGAEITATFKVGHDAVVSDSNLAGNVDVSKATTLSDQADGSLAAGGTDTIAADSTRRACIISANPNNVETLRVSFTGGARGAFLVPGGSVTINSTAAIKVYNPGAAGAQGYGVLNEKD